MMNRNRDFYAALALFQSLFKSKKGDIYTIIERFVLVGIKMENLQSFGISDVEDTLRNHFSIKIPKSVITHCLVNTESFYYKDNAYHVKNSNDPETESILKELELINSQNDDIASELYEFIEHKHLVTLTENEKDELRELFFDFVEDRDIPSEHKYFQDVAHFIVKKEEDPTVQQPLDAIKEGTIIYRGIRYSDMSTAQTWKNDIVFFLDMEYLFGAFGLNGTFYKEYFFDFYNLIKEINDGSPRRNNIPRIQLMYFQRTKMEIDKFFNMARRIKEGKELPIKRKEAFRNIDKNCSDGLSVLKYKNQFYQYLNNLGITEYPYEINRQKNRDYLFETTALQDKIQNTFEPDEQEDVVELLHFADNINILRSGRKSARLDDCGFIFLSASRLSTRFSKFLRENDKDAKAFVMCSMNLFTEEMWFRLRKGIMSTDHVASFKVVSRAKCVISSLLNDSVTKNYQKLKESGEDIEIQKGVYADLRSKECTPESVNNKTVDDDIAFVNDDDFFHAYEEEQVKLRRKAQRTEEVEDDLRQRKEENKQLKDENIELRKKIRHHNYEQGKKARRKAKIRFCGENFVYTHVKHFVWLTLILLVVFAIYMDRNLGLFTIISGIASIVAYLHDLPNKIQKRAKFFRSKRYRGYIKREIDKISDTI